MRIWSVPRFGTVAAALFMASTLLGGLNGNRLSFVPWRVLAHDDQSPPSLLVLYWIPTSPEEMKRSDLVTSQTLLSYAARCVAMQVVRHDDDERIEHFGATGQLPTAVLVDRAGQVVSRLYTDGEPLRVGEVEKMVRDAIDTREVAAERLLDSARRLAAGGNHDAAAPMYRQVIEQRCAFPRLAKEAQRALKKIERR